MRAVVGAADELEIVRRHQHRGARRVDLAKQLEDAARRALVEVSGRLVGDEHERIVDQRAGERDALLFAAGELAGKRRGLGREADLRQRARDLVRRCSARGVPITSSANATFCSAVRSSSRRKSWKTMPSRRRSFGDVALLDRRRSCSR